METAGLNEEAAEYYYQSLLKNPDYIESRQGLYRTGEQVLNNEISSFFQHYQLGQKKEAVYSFRRAIAFKYKLETVAVKLSISPQYIADFEEVKAAYLTEQYEIGLGYMDEEKYAAAEAIFKEISNLEPNYKDSKNLERIAYVEPLYQKGKEALEQNRFRTAYYAFDDVAAVDSEYKDAKGLRSESLENGLVTMGIISFENGTAISNANKKLEAFVLTGLSKTGDPFLKIIDRTSYDQLIEEQKLNLSGVVDESTAAEAGHLLGVKFILGGTLLQLSKETGKLNRYKKTGFKEIRIKKHNEETGEDYYVTNYKKVYYYEYRQQNRAYISAQIKIMSLTTGEILVSEIISKESIDDIHYYKYDGNGSKLYPSIDGKVNKDYTHKKQMEEYLGSRKAIRSADVLADNSFRALAGTIKTNVENFSYQYVK